jgi:ABC-type dipeptide/oligopeptide/nickel transport system permease subunit
MNKIKNWIANKIETISLILFILGYTTIIFFMGIVYEWDKYRRVRDVGVEIQTRIIEYRLGTTTLGRDTLNVIEEAPKAKMKADKFD